MNPNERSLRTETATFRKRKGLSFLLAVLIAACLACALLIRIVLGPGKLNPVGNTFSASESYVESGSESHVVTNTLESFAVTK